MHISTVTPLSEEAHELQLVIVKLHLTHFVALESAISSVLHELTHPVPALFIKKEGAHKVHALDAVH